MAKRWHPPGVLDGSWDSAEDAAEAGSWGDEPSREEMLFFEVCAECGRIEQSSQPDLTDAGRSDYLESLWPCLTVRTLTTKRSTP